MSRRWWLPDRSLIRLRQCHAKPPVLIICQPSLSSAFSELDDPVGWIVGPKALAHGVGENRAEQSDGAASDTTASTYDR